MDLTAERARHLFCYNKKTGSLTWRRNKGRAKAGSEVGSFAGNNLCRATKVDGKNYLVHRIIWLYVTGKWPRYEIDHKDGDNGNNAWKNLRDVPRVLNQQNQRHVRSDSRTGVQGVGYDGGFIRARVTVAGKQKFLGYFNTVEEAHQAYLAAKRQLHVGCTL